MEKHHSEKRRNDHVQTRTTV